jgi:hypothetical protein
MAETGNVSRACTAAGGIARSTVYDARSKFPDFAAAWDSAYEQSIDMLEAEAKRRAHDGLVRYKFDRGVPVLHPTRCVCGHHVAAHLPVCCAPGCSCQLFAGEPYYELEYSDTLLIFLLKGGRPGKYRDRMDIGLGNDEVDTLIKRELAKLAASLQVPLALPPPGAEPGGGAAGGEDGNGSGITTGSVPE